MTNTTPAPPPADTPTPHTIRTDRPCARCGFNLFGQPIIREPHYQLIAARCPECGQLAALQEYPALGKWADRWAKILAALSTIVVIAALAAQFGPTLGLMFGLTETSREDLAITIASSYTTWQSEQQGPQPQVTFGISGWNAIDPQWWADNKAALTEAAGGRASAFNQQSISIAMPLLIISFGFGAFWSTVLLGTRHRIAFGVACVPAAVAIVFVWFATASRYDPNTTLIARDAAGEVLRPIIIPAGALGILTALALGAFLGRKITRTLVRLALPPRMRTALSILWTRDNLPPPTART